MKWPSRFAGIAGVNDFMRSAFLLVGGWRYCRQLVGCCLAMRGAAFVVLFRLVILR